MKIYTKELLIATLNEIAEAGWVEGGRHGNHGSVGNTLEDLLGIEENNLPIPNAAEWELKTQRIGSSSLTTLFHTEPSPTALKFVPSVLLPLYGWAHKEAGNKYSDGEMSFRQTINGMARTDRGFIINVDYDEKKILVSFDASAVSPRHAEWLAGVEKKIGLGELNPQPYWGFEDIEHKVGSKLNNCFFVQAAVKKVDGKEFYKYEHATMLKGLNFAGFLECLTNGTILVDFDARTGHNHGTKFRIRQNSWPKLYRESINIF